MAEMAANFLYKDSSPFQRFLLGFNQTILLKGCEGTGKS